MKKILSLLVLFGIVIALQGNTAPENHVMQLTQDPAFIQYTWYFDSGYTYETGSVLSLAAELSRLRSDYPGYVFSQTPSVGLLPFEWGYFAPGITAVIFSNLY